MNIGREHFALWEHTAKEDQIDTREDSTEMENYEVY